MERANYGHEEGLYDRNGFFFRQRRGHLNLRKFEALDLDRIVREVDVDLLQQTLEEITFSKFTEHEIQFFSDKQVVKLFNLAQLTIEYLLYSQEKLVKSLNDLAKKYTGKKRALHQKRKEMNGLKEEAASLQNQLRAKRRNLATLEKVVREANEIKAVEAPVKPKRSPFVKFFVTLPNGLFVEFEELRDTTIRQLLLMLRNALANHRSQGAIAEAGDSLKLFLKGKLLILDHSLERCGLQDGDTILVAIPDDEPPKRVEIAPAPAPEIKIIEKTDKESLVIQQKVLEAVEKQVNSLEELAGFLAKNKVQESRDSLSERLAEELARIHDLLEKNRLQPPSASEVQRAVAPLILGDLEPDGDDNAMAIQEINLKLMQSNLRMNSLDNNVQLSMTDLKDLLRMQQEELAELRKALLQRPNPTPSNSQTIIYEAAHVPPSQQSTIVIQQPQPTPEPQQAQPQPAILIEEKPKLKQQRKFVLEQLKESVQQMPAPILVAEEKQEKTSVEMVMNFEPKSKEEEPKPVPKVVEIPTLIVKKPESPPPVVVESPVTTPVVSEMVTITFSSKHYVGYVPPDAEDTTVEVESDLQVVDIIFEVRKAVANKMNLPFKSTCLVMDGRAIKLGVDIDENLPFSVKDAAEYAKQGRLSIKFDRVQLLTNDKIDRITPAWEKSASESKLRESADAKEKTILGNEKRSLGSKSTSRRSYEDEESYGEDEKRRGFKSSYTNMRTSFDSLLRDLSERRSMSDQELAEKRQLLEATSASESESAKHMRSSLAKAMSNIAVESGSESAGDEFFRSSLRFSRDLSASLNASNLDGSKAGLQKMGRQGTERDSVGNWRAMVASSPDFITLRRPGMEDEDIVPIMSRSFSQSLPRRDNEQQPQRPQRRAPRRSYDDDNDDTPMLSSLNQPLPRFADTHDHLPLREENRETREELLDIAPHQRKTFQSRRTWQADNEDDEFAERIRPQFQKVSNTNTMSQSFGRSMGEDEPTPSFISSLGSRDQSTLFASTDPQSRSITGAATLNSSADSKLLSQDKGRDNKEQDQHSNKSSPPQNKDAKGLVSMTSTIQSQQSIPSQQFELSSTLNSSQLPDFGTGEIHRGADAYERTGMSDTTEISALDTTMRTDDGIDVFGVSKGSNDSPFKTLRGRADSRESTAGLHHGSTGGTHSTLHQTGASSHEDTVHDLDTMSTYSLAISEGDRTED
jgi:zinc finger protein DZIP1